MHSIQLVSEAILNAASQHNSTLPEIVSSGVRATKCVELLSCDNVERLPNMLMRLIYRVLHLFWCHLEKYRNNQTGLPESDALSEFYYLHHSTLFLTNLCRTHLNDVQVGGKGLQDRELVAQFMANALPNVTTRRWWMCHFTADALEVRTKEFTNVLRRDYVEVVPEVLHLRISNLLVRLESNPCTEVIHVLDVGLLCAENINIVDKLETILVTGHEVPRTFWAPDKENLVTRKEMDFKITVERDMLKKQNEQLCVALHNMESHVAELKCIVRALCGECFSNVQHDNRKAQRLRDQLHRWMQRSDSCRDMLSINGSPPIDVGPIEHATARSPSPSPEPMAQTGTRHVHVTLASKPNDYVVNTRGFDTCAAAAYTTPVKFFNRTEREASPHLRSDGRRPKAWKPATSFPR